ncbi:hypothetical protein ACHAWF_008743 [Thalassiosira exigua]
MRSLLALLVIAATASAFAPGASRAAARAASSSRRTTTPPPLGMGFGGDPERKSLTRDSEPDEFFSTNTDKMSDEEKLPIAIMGLVGISAPFIAGLIALYAAK